MSRVESKVEVRQLPKFDGVIQIEVSVDAIYQKLLGEFPEEYNSVAIRHNRFYNSMGTLGYLIQIDMGKKMTTFIFGYVSGCFYPMWYKIHA
jgi:hypothetical protein